MRATVHAFGQRPEFVSHRILEWISQTGIATALSDPGKPWRNGADESFNGKFRDERSSLDWFRSRREAAVVIEAWRQHYDAVRPHSSLAYLTPPEFRQQHQPVPTRAAFQEDWFGKGEQVMTRVNRSRCSRSSARRLSMKPTSMSQLDRQPSPPHWRQILPSWLRNLIWSDSASTYDAFLSYPWASDKRIAEQVQTVVQQFLRPWHKTRAKTIFRDLSALPAGSSLSDELRFRLNRSQHLIVLANKHSAKSAGMEDEAQWWMEKEQRAREAATAQGVEYVPHGQIIVLVTEGGFDTWDDVRAHALPPTLRARLDTPPLWISIAALRDSLLRTDLPPARKELAQALRQLLLRLYPNQTWEELVGEERTLRTRARRLVLSTVAAFLVLGSFAASESIQSRRERSVAKSRELAAQAEQMLREDRGRAVGLALSSWQEAKTAEARLAVARSFPSLAVTLPGQVASLSHDGARIITAQKNGAASIWSVADGRLLVELKGHAGETEQAALSSDGKWAATAGNDRTARIWNAESGQCVATLTEHTKGVYSLDFSSDGRFLATGGEDGDAFLWEVPSGRLHKRLPRHTGAVVRVRFSRDGSRLLTASMDASTRVWRTADGELAFALSHAGAVWDAEFSEDGKRIVTASIDKTALLWNAADGERLAEIKEHKAGVKRAAFLPNGSLVTADGSGMTLVSTTSGKTTLAIATSSVSPIENRAVNDIAISHDGKWIATASSDGSTKVWSASTGKLVVEVEGNGGGIRQVLFSPNGQQVVVSDYGDNTRIWSLAAASAAMNISIERGFCSQGTFSPDGLRMIVSDCSSDRPRIVCSADGSTISHLEAEGASQVRFSPSGSQILTRDTVMDARGKSVFWLNGHSNSISRSEFSPNGRYIVTASRDKNAIVWNAKDGSQIVKLPHDDRLHSASFSKDSRMVATAGHGGSAVVWSAESGAKQRAFRSDKPLRSIAFSPNSQRILAGSDEGIARVWELAGPPKGRVLHGHTGSVRHVAFSPDGLLAITAGEREVMLWDASQFALIAKLDGGKGGGVSGVQFSRDSKRVLMSTQNYRAAVYETQRGALIGYVDGIKRHLINSFMSEDGVHFVALNRDGSAYLHRLWSLADLDYLLNG
jgi:WD40 repeat protein